ncbi:uncharacterized protein LOC124284183 [Haliotis rubra]|uniref:uncharacterized protein LOC124284183 n=1 Tax=Haliotis rubra TaxID=36100 RepID=UPI001EE54EE2|nr:uncharacterized protein LOC124284183 [Haliotis rubra]
MMSSNLGEIVFISLWIVKLVHCDSCFEVATVIQRDKYMEHQVFRKFRSPSLYMCASECLMSSACVSFGFDKKRRTCLLNDKDSANGNVVDRTGYLFSDILHWPGPLSGPCSVVSCPASSRCQVDRLGRATCVPEFRGCGQPPEVTDASKTYEGHYQGGVTTYTCRQDFTACHDKVTSICQSSGQWENLMTGLCSQNVWHNPALDVKYALPCGPSREFRATLIGTPNQATRWNIWLWKDDNVLALLEFRILFGESRNETVLNSLLNGLWGEHITADGHLPMTVGHETEIQITLHSGIYRLEIDGMSVYNLTERLTGGEPVSVSVEGGVALRLMEIQLN